MLLCVCLDSNTRKGAEEGSPGNSAAASALIISTSGFGPTWRLTDGNTDDSPKDRLDLYDGKELLCFGFVVGFWFAAPGVQCQDARLVSCALSLIGQHDNNM